MLNTFNDSGAVFDVGGVVLDTTVEDVRKTVLAHKYV
jgi:hypothetical protein